LLTDKGLHAPAKSYVRSLARALTLTVLEEQSPTRKRILVLFLHESGLINKNKPVISLARADLKEADLSGVELRRTNLSGANLERANLFEADLQGADLRKANLINATLDNCNLAAADLREAAVYAQDYATRYRGIEQFKRAYVDEATKLPDYLKF
jgi:uncharacterized protein YjbI with pentapeptide repeats